ncbi:MAG: hypothetical protein ACR2PW_05230 [Gammaproteobacteria bacterium]
MVVDILGFIIGTLASVELSALLITGMFVLALMGQLGYSSRPFLAGLARNAPTLLTSLGITFTFMGVLRGLLDFDLDNIDVGISELLEGLKVAFMSSVLGISFAFIFRLVAINDSEEALSSDDPIDIMRNGLQGIIDAIKGSEEGSMVNQMEALRETFESQTQHLHQSFKEFTQSVVDSGTEAMMQSLTDIVTNFNGQITDQFGGNLEQFNGAVTNLMKWQQDYKVELDGVMGNMGNIRDALTTSTNRMESVSQETGNLSAGLSAMQDALATFRSEIESMESGMRTLSDVKDKAQEALPEMSKGLDAALTKITAVNKSVADGLQKSSDLQTQAAQLIAATAEKLEERIQQSQAAMQKTSEESVSIVSANIEQLDRSMQDEIQRCVQAMANNITRITEEFVKQYERLAKS